jgi:uncharacterized Zn finger protein
MGYYDGFRPYVPVAQRRAQAAKEVARRIKKGEKIFPIVIEGRTITSTFWGKAWCENLEGYSDFENRLPRGRTYVRNGSVVHLNVAKGRINALVSGSELYTVEIEIAELPKPDWIKLKAQSAGKVGTLVELLLGKLSQAVMAMVTGREFGLFPKPKEIKMRCSCPDYAGMCKHVAAVMYGVGNRLDKSPELLFLLRGVDHRELIEQAIPDAPIRSRTGGPKIDASDLGAIFDIEIGDAPAPQAATTSPKKPVAQKPTIPKKTATPKAESKVPKKSAAKPAVKTAAPSKKTATPKAETKVAAKPAVKAAGAPKRTAVAKKTKTKTKAKAVPRKKV